MASCDACGNMILFGGAWDRSGRRYCNQQCMEKDSLVRLADMLPADMVAEQTRIIHQGRCPSCHGEGPVDIHCSHSIWSALILTSWKTTPKLCCRSCGVKNQVGDLVFSLLAGWWGFPCGLIMTPVQIARNLGALMSGPNPSQPSPALVRAVKSMMGDQVAQERAPLQ